MRKVNKDWYRVVTKADRFQLPVEAVDVLRTRHNEWSVCDGEPEIGSRNADLQRYVFIKLADAKKFAEALAEAIKNETPYPRRFDY
jgi:hypothetical protein